MAHHSKFICLILTFLLVVSSSAQIKKAVLTFKDGTIKEGLGKIHNGSSVKFRLDKKSQPSLYHFAGLDSLKLFEDPDPVVYVYLQLSNKKEPKVVKQLQTGKVSLYYRITGQNSSTKFENSTVTTSARKDIYVKRANEKVATYLGSLNSLSKKFRNAATKYFTNCPELVKKISNKELTSYDMRRIANFYNSICTHDR